MNGIRMGDGHQQGFTLIELMVSLVIGLIIILGASQLFIASRESFDRIEILAERQQSLRFLSDSISLDVRTADSGRMVVSGAGSTLTLTYTENRENDPYCTAGQKLTGLVYQFESSENTLKLSPECDSVALGPQPLVSGVELVRFNEGFIQGSRAFIDVTLRFSPLGEESALLREVSFMATNRAMAIALVNAGR